MTAGLEKFLNLPPLDEVLKERGIDLHAPKEEEPEPELPDQEDIQQAISSLRDISAKVALLEGTDHSEDMDKLFEEIITHARDLISYGFNTDQRGARGIFEIASLMYGHALSAKNSKRDAQIKALKLALDRRKVDLTERKLNHDMGNGQIATTDNNSGMIVVEDRNELIKRIRDQIKKTD
jgi:hypothetical protein